MKKILIFAVIVSIIIFGFIRFGSDRGGLVGEEILVSTFLSEGEETGSVLIQVPFIQSTDARRRINIYIDLNEDGAFTENELLVNNFPVSPKKDWRSGYYASSESVIDDGMRALVEISGKEYEVSVATKAVDVGDLLDLSSVTNPELATKGWGMSVAYAEDSNVELSYDDVPDLTQRRAECGPTAAANSLISLVKRNGGDDLIPGDPQDFIENLKRHMNWTPENGTPPDDFVAGKNRWAAAAGVPIRTTKVGDTNGTGVIDAIRDALQNGDGVELRIKFGDADGTPRGGHMVTVTGLLQGEGQTYLEINDPATPDSGTETVEVRGISLTNYGPWTGLTQLSWGFIQTWEDVSTGTLLDTMTDAEIQGIQQFVGDTPMITVIKHGEKYIPVSQLKVTDEEGCEGGARHWHAISSPVTATDGTVVTEPPVNCGFGTVASVPSRNIPAPNNND